VRPPAILSSRIGGAEADYPAIGRAHADWLRESLPQEWDWTGKAVLDFGCGTARSLTHFEDEASSGDFWGCDIDGDSIAWASANLSPPFHFARNDALPPLPFPEGKFDLVYGFSVFTHLLDSWSDWLLEMHRVLTVGGYGVFTFLGEGMFGDLTGRPWDPDRVGMISLDAGRPWMIGGPNALHSEWWLRGHWGRAFSVEHVEPYRDPTGPRGHGLVVLRKDDRRPPTRQELEELVPGDPRELKSLQLNVELLLERSARLWQTNGSTAGAVASVANVESVAAEVVLLRRRLDELTRSKSWRLTAPLRSLRRSLTERRNVG
jgi:SAM-dependent methyltransferase